MARHNSPGAVAFFAVVLIAAVCAVAWLFRGFATDCILAFLFTGLLSGLYQKVLKRVRGHQTIAAAICSAVFVVIVLVPVTFIVSSLTVEAQGVIAKATALVQSEDGVGAMSTLEAHLFGDALLARNVRSGAEALGIDYTPENLRQKIGAPVAKVVGWVYAQAQAVFTNTFSFLFHFILVVLIIFYMLIDGHRLKAFVFRLSPLPNDQEEMLARKFKSVGRAILFGNGMGSVVQGIFGGIAMAIAGLPSPVLWAVMMSIFAFLPLVGISVVTVPASLYLALTGRYLAAIVFFLFTAAVGLFVENVVKTKLIGQHMQMHNLLIFLSIIAGLAAFGILGLLYGPLIVAFFLAIVELYEAEYKPDILRESGIPQKASGEP